MALETFVQASMNPPTNGTPEADPKIPISSNFDVVITANTDVVNSRKSYPKIAEMVYGSSAGNVAIPDPNPLGFQAGDAVPDFIKLIEVSEDGEETETGDEKRIKIAYNSGYAGAPSYPTYASMPVSTTIRINPVSDLGYGKRYKIEIAAELPAIVVNTTEA